jgi:murein DD-endopeptidase MepM/ murein hydrolase activator NlpD
MPLIKLNLYSSLFIGLLGFVLLSSHSFSNHVKKATEFKTEGGDDEEKKENFDSTFSTAWELYINTWDTDNLNPYLYDFNSFKSPVNICLAPDSNGFVMPVYNTVTSNFGWRKGRAHNGIDIDLETGDTVVTAFEGVVRMSKYYHGYGNMVVVRHPNGLETLYGHLSKVLVEAGQSIKAGEIVGLGGNTGHSYGSHLHFEIRFMGQPIDPAKFISFENFSLVNNEVLIDENLFQSNKLVKKQKNGRSIVHEHVIPVKYHKIKQGDTLSAIARRNKTTVSKLCKLNGLKETSILRLGQKIKVK